MDEVSDDVIDDVSGDVIEVFTGDGDWLVDVGIGDDGSELLES